MGTAELLTRLPETPQTCKNHQPKNDSKLRSTHALPQASYSHGKSKTLCKSYKEWSLVDQTTKRRGDHRLRDCLTEGIF